MRHIKGQHRFQYLPGSKNPLCLYERKPGEICGKPREDVIHGREQKSLKDLLKETVVAQLTRFTPEERLEVFGHFCKFCGDPRETCQGQCANDD